MTVETYTFGVEFEAYLPVGMSRQALATDLTNAGLRTAVAAYGHTVTSHWRIVTDGSLGDYTRGIELVSPVLRGEAGLAHVATACRVMMARGVTVNSKCGFHVHVGVGSKPLGYFKRLVRLFQAYEKTIDQMMTATRRGSVNTYCRSLGSMSAASIDAAYSVADLANRMKYASGAAQARYHKLNLSAYGKYETVEFRQHSGTIDATKTRNWILTCIRFCDAAVREMPIATAAPQVVNKAKRGTKRWQIGEMLLGANGVSRSEICAAMGWPSVSIPQVAEACRLDVYSQRTGREVRYYVRRAAAQTSAALDTSLGGLCALIGSTHAEAEYLVARTAALNPIGTHRAIAAAELHSY